MSLKYDFFKEPDLTSKGEEKLSPRVVYDKDFDKADIDYLVKMYSGGNSQQALLLKSNWELLLSHVMKALSQGKYVHLNGLGYLSLSCKSRKDSPKATDRSGSLEFKEIKFRQERNVARKLGALNFERVHVKKSSTLPHAELEEKIAGYLRQNHYITREALQRLTGYSRHQAIMTLNNLVDTGKLVRNGHRNLGVYTLGEE